MEKAQLAAMCFLLSTFVATQALPCVPSSNSCKEPTCNEVMKRLTGRSSLSLRSSRAVSSSDDCRAVPGTPNSMASSSPWRYVEDFMDSRYPQRLWKAECICQNSCISLRHPVKNGTQETFVEKERNGKSVPIFADIDVHYRKPCANNKTGFCLRPGKYSLPIGCTCVAAW